LAAEGWNEDDRLEDILATVRKHRHGSFHGLVAYLERATRASVRIGGDGPVRDEPIRFQHDNSMGFSCADVSEIELEENANGRRPAFKITTTFLGLTGSVTPLPTYFATEVSQDQGDEGILKAFLDIFHHRVLSLFYRSTVRYSPAVEFQRDARDHWSKRILALAGIDTYEGDDPPLPRWRLLRLAPLLVRQGSSVWALQTALQDVLDPHLDGATVEVLQFVGSWVNISDTQQMHLGVDNSNLGLNSVLGQRAFDTTGKFRIVLGPLTADGYATFQHDLSVKRLIAATVSLFCRDPLDYDLALILAEDAIPGLRLSVSSPSKLGIDTFLGRQGESEIVIEMPSASSLIERDAA